MNPQRHKKDVRKRLEQLYVVSLSLLLPVGLTLSIRFAL